MSDGRSRILWVMDGMVGHLAIAHREGFLRKLYGRSSIHFRNADDALASIDTDGVPTAILVGFALTSDLSRLLADPRLRDVPFLIADRRPESSQYTELDNVYRASETMDLYEALENFSVNVVNTTTPSWPRES